MSIKMEDVKLDDIQAVSNERQKLKALIEKLVAKDRLLYKKQRELEEHVSASSNGLDEKPQDGKPDTPVIHELEQPLNQFWGQDKVALVSYPRSGNSLLRRIVEKLTGTVTGSDARADRPLVRQLAEMGMRGEGVMDSRVWCVKTHYPERVGRARLVATRAILIVRNPFDSIASFFQMMLSDSHSKSVSAEEVHGKFFELWNDFLYEELSIWMQFHAHWRKVSAPMLVLRYEDLVAQPSPCMKKIADFLYGPLVQNGQMNLSEIDEKLAELNSINLAEIGIYPPKAKLDTSSPQQVANQVATNQSSSPLQPEWPSLDPMVGGFARSLNYYTRDQFRHVLAAARSDLVYYGYWNVLQSLRPHWAPDLVPYVDISPGGCMLEESNRLRLNSRYALRPRFELDPYGRGFDVRWDERLKSLPKAVCSEGRRKSDKKN